MSCSIAGQKSGIVWAFDPDDSGKVVWQTRIGKGGINGGIQWGIASDGQRVYAAVSDVGVTRTATARTLDPSAGGGLAALDLPMARSSGAPIRPCVRIVRTVRPRSRPH